MINAIYLQPELFETPQIKEATSILNDWWKSKLCGLGVSHRASTEGDTLNWDFGFPIHSTIDNVDEIFDTLGITNYEQAKQALIEFDEAEFDYPIPAVFMDGMEGKACKFWGISVTHALDQSRETYSIYLGWFDIASTGFTEWNGETFDRAGVDWFNSLLPGNLEDYNGFPGVDEVKYV